MNECRPKSYATAFGNGRTILEQAKEAANAMMMPNSQQNHKSLERRVNELGRAWYVCLKVLDRGKKRGSYLIAIER